VNRGFRGSAVFVSVPLMLVVALSALFGLVVPVWSPGAEAAPLPDYNEPNDSYETATVLESGEAAWGAIGPEDTDKDYFCLDIPESSAVYVQFTAGVPGRICDLLFQSEGSVTKTPLTWAKIMDDEGDFHSVGAVGPGRFFAVVSLGGAEVSSAAYTITVTFTGGGGDGDFADVPAGSDFYAAITYLAREGVVSGYQDGRFGPDDLITRQQFAKIIVGAARYFVSTTDSCPFADVDKSYPGHYMDPNDPLYPDHYIAVAAGHHITVGKTASVFAPYQNITLAQMVTMVVRAGEDLGVYDSPPGSYTPRFTDFGEPHYAYAREGDAHGLFEGYPGPWRWFSPATRGQCAFFIWKLMIAHQGGGPASL